MPPAFQSDTLTWLLTALAMLAFAANSVICRLALEGGAIDAASFSSIRLAAGALTLLLICAARRPGRESSGEGSWRAAALLFLYAVCFSFAYLSLAAGTGALILFGAVQVTMILAALASGERPHRFEWLGLLLALAGLVYLVLPGLSAPSPLGSALMATAGVAWGIYSLLGRASRAPLQTTAGNFVRSLPLVAAVSLLSLPWLHLSATGVLLAVLSGALASGVGYVIWYAALRGLTATRAATVQLSVPVLAALGGVALLAEPITLRLLLSAALILGGIGMALAGRAEAGKRTS